MCFGFGAGVQCIEVANKLVGHILDGEQEEHVLLLIFDNECDATLLASKQDQCLVRLASNIPPREWPKSLKSPSGKKLQEAQRQALYHHQAA